MRIRKLDAAAGSLALGLGAALAVAAGRLPPSRTADVGAGRAPMLIGIAIAVVAIAILVRSFRDGASTPEHAEVGRGALVLFTASAAYLLAIGMIGYIPASALFIIAIVFWKDGRARIGWGVVSAASYCALIYLIFDIVIESPLP